MKKLRVGMLFAALAVILLAGVKATTVEAAELTREEAYASDDPEAMRANGYADDTYYSMDDATNDRDVIAFNKASRGDSYITKQGMDVSKWQGKIDWQQARNAGIEFAIIRVGYRSLDTNELGEDTYYQQNIEGALNAGIKVGVYIFSQARNEAEAVEEANYVLDRIYKYNITLPVVIDYEYGSDGRGALYNAFLTREQGTAAVNAFCKRVTELGYTGMVYANKNMFNNYLNANDISDKYRIWLAHYTEQTDYDKAYDMWQYTSKASGAAYGCSSTYLDMDYWYDDGTINGQDYGGVFNSEYYASHNPDVLQAYGPVTSALLKHFIDTGMAEGRQGSESFNVYSYICQYEDVRKAFGNDLKSYYLHYMSTGRLEGRAGSGYENQFTSVDGDVMWRLYNPNSGEHFYTASDGERNSLIKQGWSYEGVGWFAPKTGNPVYRVYNPNAGDHHYTMSAYEMYSLVASGWSYEGIGFYSDQNNQVPLYRSYNPNARAGSHNYTTNRYEYDVLAQNGWNNENIAWYGIN